MAGSKQPAPLKERYARYHTPTHFRRTALRTRLCLFGHLIFERVIASSTCELDTYENLVPHHMDDTRPSFVEIQNSPWLERLPVRQDFDHRIYRHFRLYTYDTVLDVFAASYTWQIDF